MVIHDIITVERTPEPVKPPMKIELEEANDSNESFSASEMGDAVAETGGIDSAGEEDE